MSRVGVTGWMWAAVATISLASSAPADVASRAAPLPDYSAMLKLSSDAAGARLPTPQELELLRPVWPTAPMQQNAAYYFVKAAAAMPKDQIPAGSLLATSAGAVVGDTASFEKWIERNRPALDNFSKGLSFGTCEFPAFIHDQDRAPVPTYQFLPEMRTVARLLCDAGFLQELKNQPDAAADAYLDGMRLGARLREHSVLIVQMVGLACTGMSQTHLERLVANSSLSDEALHRVIAGCRQAEGGRDELCLTWAREMDSGKAAVALNSLKPFGVLENLMYAQHFRASEKIMVILASKNFPELLQKKNVDDLLENELKDAKQIAFVALRWVVELGRLNLRLRVTQIRAGIKLYQKSHGGQLPETLAALCPDILPSVPIDPFSGGPMRYARTADGWKVWSVGEDGVDNGGVVEPGLAEVWDGADYIFISNIPSNLVRRIGK